MANSRRTVFAAAVIGLLLTAPLTGLLYLGFRLAGLPMVAFDLFEGLVRIPQLGGVVTKAIDVMVGVFSRIPGAATDSASKGFEQFSAIGLFLVLGAVAGVVYTWLRRTNRSAGIVIGLTAWVIALGVELSGSKFSNVIIIDIIWLAALFAAWGYALGWAIDTFTTSQQLPANDPNRRRFLLQLGGSVAGVTLASWGIGSLLNRDSASSAGRALATPTPAAGNALTATESVASAGTSAGSFAIVPGTRAEITPNEEFYRVDVNVASVPSINEKEWELTVGGLTNEFLRFSYDDMLKMPSTEFYATLECISNPVGGDLISTTRWTGVKMADLLKKAGLKDNVKEIKITCADGYTESLPVESAMDEHTVLAYAMNGEALAKVHGFPMRLYTPNRYGMKNPKWIISLEAIPDPYDGYWEVRYWNKDAFVKSTAVIDTIDKADAKDGVVPVGGIAFGGDRGISKVELSVDGGPWQQAELKPPVAPLDWVLWRWNWKAEKGHHSLQVRTTDGKGGEQIEQVAGLHPSGASGYFSMDVDI